VSAYMRAITGLSQAPASRTSIPPPTVAGSGQKTFSHDENSLEAWLRVGIPAEAQIAPLRMRGRRSAA
jgi:hypothetical protein